MKKIITAVLLLAMVLGIFSACQSKEENSNESHNFKLEIVYEDGEKETLDITTTEKTVAGALLEKNIIEGEDGPYGLYIKKVNGHLADFEKNGMYWAFYIDGEYATKGAEKTEIKDGSTYTLKVEK